MHAVSVIIPCFNLGRYLPEAVDSVLRQTLSTYQLIIVDDGSTDAETLSVLQKYRDEGVTVYTTPNHGAPAARNFGIARASGHYILCLDADDILLPTFLKDTTAVLHEHARIGVVTPYVEFFGDRKGVWRTTPYNPGALLKENCIASASLFRKTCWEQVDGYHDLPAFQDWDFWISIMEAGWQWSVVPEVLYRYRVRKKSISEYGRANRGTILRKLVQRHATSYRTHFEDIFVAADNELQSLRARVSKYAHDNAAQAETISSLKSELSAIKNVTLNAESHHNSRFRTVIEAQTSDADRIRALKMRVSNLDTEREYLVRELAKWESIDNSNRLIRQHVPCDSRILVVSRGDEELIQLPGYRAAHFPQDDNGKYAGYHPAHSRDAINRLESLRTHGAEDSASLRL